MLVSQLQYLPKEKQFEIYYKRAIENYAYINEDGKKITFNSSYETIKNEFNRLDINCIGKTIDELYENLRTVGTAQLSIGANIDILRGRFGLLFKHLEYIEFYQYDYDYAKMPSDVQYKFEVIKDFSNLMKIHNIES
ncbi:hypothetical protein SAMN05443667_11929 [Flavobacterium gillisiae]|uniref:Uncharacterized protein n=1 Tax=Flavobacterium gillisiae TaxID=150146 RepID=A0A1H4GCB8_9FLAO|nr:hypothetical protein [Flavobacterium gillisiae]SEB06650.1 hypothetical protein SAMN05443667_11929 [Flavobacterium gillisiae]